MLVRLNATRVFLFAGLLAVYPGTSSGAGAGNVQALVGAAKFQADSLTFAVPSEGASSGPREKDLDTMPYLGVTGQYPLVGDQSQMGVEAGAFFGWRSRKTDVVVGTGGTAVNIDSDLWLLDLSAGLYLSQMVGSRWRFYLGGGPAIIFGEYHEDGHDTVEGEDDVADRSDSEFGVGAYVRGGIEYQYYPGALVGFSVRGLTSNLQFDTAIGDENVKGIQGFVTFTAFWPSRRYGWDAGY